MDDAVISKFNSHGECSAYFADVLARSSASLLMFDPDFAVFNLGSSANDAALRHFLSRGGHMQLAMHETAHIEREYPRFMQLLRDYGHRIECRVTNRPLRTLTDSFCIGDGEHIVRRFHRDHMRGEAAFHSPISTEISNERFIGIWAESLPGLQGSTTGL